VDDPEERCSRLALDAQIVKELFNRARVAGITVMMSVVNWGEVYCTLVKRIGIAKAEGVIAETLRSAPIALLSVTPVDAIRAARLKAQYNVPFADLLACARRQSECSCDR